MATAESRRITFVKKVLANGEPCGKCRDVEARLTEGRHWPAIDQTLVADERDPSSAGMRLAERLNVTRAPFFVVESPEETQVYTVYFKFLREVLQRTSRPSDEARELLNDNPDLDFI
jgi:hypothetical protein